MQLNSSLRNRNHQPSRSKKTKTKKLIDFILPIKPVRITYRNEWSYQFNTKAAQKPNNYTRFHKTKDIYILTDKKTICPKKPIVLKLKFERYFLEKLGLKYAQAVRTAEYYDYYSSARSKKRKKDILAKSRGKKSLQLGDCISLIHFYIYWYFLSYPYFLFFMGPT